MEAQAQQTEKNETVFVQTCVRFEASSSALLISPETFGASLLTTLKTDHHLNLKASDKIKVSEIYLRFSPERNRTCNFYDPTKNWDFNLILDLTHSSRLDCTRQLNSFDLKKSTQLATNLLLVRPPNDDFLSPRQDTDTKFYGTASFRRILFGEKLMWEIPINKSFEIQQKEWVQFDEFEQMCIQENPKPIYGILSFEAQDHDYDYDQIAHQSPFEVCITFLIKLKQN